MLRKHTEETKAKMRAAAMKNLAAGKHFLPDWNGRKHRPESIEKMRVSSSGKKASLETKRKMSLARKGKPTWIKGQIMSDEHKKAISEALKGKKAHPNTVKALYKRKGKFTHSFETRKRLSMVNSKEEEWTGFKKWNNYRLRRTAKYHNWRAGVFERDDFTCRECGQRGGYLEAHHIKSFAEHPSERFETSNGVTYCKECHVLIDKKRAQFERVIEVA